ncbi:hypothetical protein LNP25_00135 [Klebsiella variicola subsp. variicola]|nr:hypothetical protein [Klebsiella variicola subsp. variicola]
MISGVIWLVIEKGLITLQERPETVKTGFIKRVIQHTYRVDIIIDDKYRRLCYCHFFSLRAFKTLDYLFESKAPQQLGKFFASALLIWLGGNMFVQQFTKPLSHNPIWPSLLTTQSGHG